MLIILKFWKKFKLLTKNIYLTSVYLEKIHKKCTKKIYREEMAIYHVKMINIEE